MSKRLTAVDKAIRAIDDKIAILQAAKQELVSQQRAQPARKSKPAVDMRAAG